MANKKNKKKRGLNISNNMLAGVLIVAIAISAIGLSVSVSNYVTGRVAEGVTNVTVNTTYGCSLTANNSVEFGTMNPSDNDDTTDGSPTPFTIQNDGTANILINVSAGGFTTLWSQPDTSDGAFEWKCAGTNGNCTKGGIPTFTSVGEGGAEVTMVDDLPYGNTQDAATLHINITVPTDEGAGAKNDTVTFTCAGT